SVSRNVELIPNGALIEYDIREGQLITSTDGSGTNEWSIDGFLSGIENGMPSLPQRLDVFASANAKSIKIEMGNCEFVDYHMELSKLRNPEYEQFQSMLKKDNEKAKFDKQEVNLSDFPVRLSNIQYRRNLGLAYVKVTPIIYDEALKTARIYTKISYRVVIDPISEDLASIKLCSDLSEDDIALAQMSGAIILDQIENSESGIVKAPGDIKFTPPGYVIYPSMKIRIGKSSLYIHRNPLTVQYSDDNVLASSNIGTGEFVFYNTKNGEMEIVRNTNYHQFYTPDPEYVIVTLKKDDVSNIVKYGPMVDFKF
ncbi:MAG: hypothetical protein NC186_04820, partial [Prevotella sp.]|nr:hypothetical protein [Prevotella sp.]